MGKAIGLIPARLASQRLPRKPLVDIWGLPMVVHVYRRSSLASSLDEVFVVTDSHEIQDAVLSLGGKAILTSPEHPTGTDRIAEAAAKLQADIFVNIQGDEALVNPHSIDKVVNFVKERSEVQIALLVNPFSKRNSPSDIKVVVNQKNEVMYLSREDIPSASRTPDAPMLKAYHIVPFRRQFLFDYASWPKGELEQIEYNEYLRILERGHKIHAVHVESSAVSVDTVEDLEFVRNAMKSDEWFPRYLI